MEKIYDILNELYKDEYRWSYTKKIYKKQSQNAKDAKEKVIYEMALITIVKFEEIKRGEEYGRR